MKFPLTGLACTLCLTTAALGASGDALTIQGNRVNVRANPNPGAPVLLQLDQGDRVVERDRSGAWVNVEIPHHDGRRGWVHDSLLVPPPGAAGAAQAEATLPPTADAAPQAAGPAPATGGPEQQGAAVVEVQGMGVNIRRGPTTDTPVIAKIHAGRLLPVLGREGRWLQVDLGDGQQGWVYETLVAPAAADRETLSKLQAAAASSQEAEELESEQPAPTADAAPAPAEAEAPVGPPTEGGPTTTAATAPEAAPAPEAEPRPAAPAASAAERGDGPRLEVLSSSVGLRSAPSRLAPVVLRLERGSEVVELAREEEWVEVAALGADGGQGWVHGSLVGPAAPAASEPQTAATTVGPGEAAEPPAVATAPVAAEERTAARAVIAGNRVNIRQDPSTGARVLTQLNEDDEVLVLGRQDEWVNIATAAEGPGRREGWVHESLVRPMTAAATATAAPSPPTDEAAGPSPADKAPAGSQTVEVVPEEAATPEEGKFDRFKATVENLNERVRRAAGVDVFSDVEDLGDGTVELTATEAWLAAPEAARRANLDTLFRLWDSVHEPDQAILVRIVENDGTVAMEKRRNSTAAGRFPAAAGDGGAPGG